MKADLTDFLTPEMKQGIWFTEVMDIPGTPASTGCMVCKDHAVMSVSFHLDQKDVDGDWVTDIWDFCAEHLRKGVLDLIAYRYFPRNGRWFDCRSGRK